MNVKLVNEASVVQIPQKREFRENPILQGQREVREWTQ